MKKVLLGPYSKSGSGITTYLLELCKELVGVGMEVTLFGFEPRPDSSYIKRQVEWIPVGRDVGPGIAFLPLQVYLINKTINKLKALFEDVDVVHGVSSSLCIGIKHSNFILTAWSMLTSFSRNVSSVVRFYKFPLSLLSPITLWQATLINSLSYKNARKIICVTEKLSELLSKKYGMERVIYVPPAINVCPNIKREDSEEANIFFVSRDISLPRKNFNTFWRALVRLDRLYNAGRVKIHIIGEVKSSVLERIRALKNLTIIVHGHLDRWQITDLYDSASRPIYVSTSIYEEFNYSLLEALSRGSVAVVSDIPAHRDQVIDRQTGFLCNPYDDLAIFTRIRRLIDDIELYNMLKIMSLKYVLKKFDWKIVLPKILKVYSDS